MECVLVESAPLYEPAQKKVESESGGSRMEVGGEVHQGVSGEEAGGRLVDGSEAGMVDGSKVDGSWVNGSKAGMDRKLCWVCQETASLQCSQPGGNLRNVLDSEHNILVSDFVPFHSSIS